MDPSKVVSLSGLERASDVEGQGSAVVYIQPPDSPQGGAAAGLHSVTNL